MALLKRLGAWILGLLIPLTLCLVLFGAVVWASSLLPESWRLSAVIAGTGVLSLLVLVIDWRWFVNRLPLALQKSARGFFGVQSRESQGPIPLGEVTIVIPAHNEARDIKRTIRSIQRQTVPPKSIIVIDDGSNDGTSEVARASGATVYYQERLPNGKTQGKAAAQTRGLSLVETEFVIMIDADTVLKEDAIEKMLPFFNEEKTAAVGGYVLPYYVGTFWEKLRQFQYHYGFSVMKAGQNNVGAIFVSSGCFTGFRTAMLREVLSHIEEHHSKNGVSLAEDQLYTWILLERGYDVRFAKDALCYVHDPKNMQEYNKQSYRWNAGYFQNLKEYRFNLFRMGFKFGVFTYFNLIYTLLGPLFEGWALWMVAQHFLENAFGPEVQAFTHTLEELSLHPFVFWLLSYGATLLSVVASLGSSLVLVLVVGFVLTILVVWIPVVFSAWKMRRDKRFVLTMWAVFPFVIVHYLDVILFYAAFVNEVLLGKRLSKWHKGHSEEASPLQPLGDISINSTMLLGHKALAHGVISVETAREVTILGLESGSSVDNIPR